MLLIKNDKNDSLSETVKPPRRLFLKVRTLLWENNIIKWARSAKEWFQKDAILFQFWSYIARPSWVEFTSAKALRASQV